MWTCICDCGSTGVVVATDLRLEKSLSCGCYMRELTSELSRTHGQSKTRLHRIWKNMRARCNRPSYPKFANYGGRGIKVCPEWDDFSAFRDWALSNGYADDLSIERKDVNAGYDPGNCIWADAFAQNANRRYTMKSSDGELWLHKAMTNGVSRDAFYTRLRSGWPIEQAISWPMNKKRPRRGA